MQPTDPAFPSIHDEYIQGDTANLPGMSLRTYAAIKMVAGMVANDSAAKYVFGEGGYRIVSEWAVEMADALLERLGEG